MQIVWKKWTKVFLAASAILFGSAAVLGQGQPLKIIAADKFCENVTAALSYHLQYQPNAKINSTQMALWLVDQIRAGQFPEYISIMSQKATLNPASMRPSGYLSTERLLSSVFLGPGLAGPGIVITDPAELKNMPFVQQGAHIILVTNTAEPLDPDRAKMVAESARRSKVRISVLWYGPTQSEDEANKTLGLAFITALTGGFFTNLSGQSNPCLMKS